MGEIKRPTRWHSNKQETHIAKELGGKKVCNSGAYRFVGGDVQLEDWLIEAKTSMSNKTQFTLKKDWFIKNRQEAIAMGKIYTALAFDFGDGEQHYVINERLFKQLVNYLKGEKENEN